MPKINRRDFILCSITGALFPLTFMVAYLGVLSWVLLIPFFLAIEKKSSRDAFILGVLTGIIVNFIGAYWLVGTLSRFGGFPIIISFIFIVILSAYSGLSLGIFSYIAARFGFFRRQGIVSALLIASLWTSVEFLFPFLFPYAIGNTQADYIPIIQIVDLFGIYALSFIIVIANVTVMRTLKLLTRSGRVPTLEAIAALVLITLTLSYGYWKIKQVNKGIAEADKIKIGMVQANFDFLEKTENLEPIVTERHKQMSRGLESADVIIWPETALQAWFPTSSDHLMVRGEMGVPSMEGKYFIVGGMSHTLANPDSGITTEENITAYNTAFLTDSNGLILGRYHKIKLLLFGEYLPFAKYFPFLKRISPASGDFTPGDELNLLSIKEKSVRIAPIICYEDIIPSFSRKFVNKGANLIVNITNDAWFGKTIAPYQHLFISIPRAIETRKYLVRSTNTGISAIIDPVGRVVQKTDTFVQTNVEGEVGIMEGEKTLYVKIGDVFPIACLIFLLGFTAVERLYGAQRLRGKNVS